MQIIIGHSIENRCDAANNKLRRSESRASCATCPHPRRLQLYQNVDAVCSVWIPWVSLGPYCTAVHVLISYVVLPALGDVRAGPSFAWWAAATLYATRRFRLWFYVYARLNTVWLPLRKRIRRPVSIWIWNNISDFWFCKLLSQILLANGI